MKRLLLFTLLFLPLSVFAQGFSEDRTSLANFLRRVHNQTNFEGIKIIQDYNYSYFISALSLEKARFQRNSDMFRVAQVRAMRQASEFVNGGVITSDLIIRTAETEDSAEVTLETIERIRSVGFTQGMELLINFVTPDNRYMVFIYSRKIE